MVPSRRQAALPRRGGLEEAAGERGSGSVLAIGLVAVLALSTAAVAATSQAVSARQRAQAAADLAALAGAQALIDGWGLGQACAESARVAAGMGADLLDCAGQAPKRLRAVCAVTVNLVALGPRQARAEALAGPP
ncbi:MAG: pilus assembly protein TadG-related protein [Bifidobacteriaceae bacterium]|nr:pilus assembly protein TadG-related protein [Bifidobacteriaceae bacterium]